MRGKNKGVGRREETLGESSMQDYNDMLKRKECPSSRASGMVLVARQDVCFWEAETCEIGEKRAGEIIPFEPI